MAEPAPEVAVGGVLVRGGRLLLVRRSRDPGAGLWSLPGGRLRAGESLHEAVVREMAEETGLDVEVDGLCGVAERRWPRAHFVIVDYWCQAPAAAEPIAGDDAAAVVWADRADLDRLDLVPQLLEFLAEHRVLDALE